MSTRLFICNTYSQLIECIQLKLTLFSDDKFCVAISDHTNGLAKIYPKIRGMGLFDETYYIKTKNVENKSIANKCKLVLHYINGNDDIWRDFPNESVDEIIYYSQTDEIYTLFAKLYKINPKIIASRYEEGIVSYDDWNIKTVKSRLAFKIRSLLNLSPLECSASNFYCYYPTLYNGKLNAVQIPRISDSSEMANILNDLFENDTKSTDYEKFKYICLTSVYDFEGGGSIGEIDAVLKVAKFVGNENLIVKAHPRDNPERFIRAGLNVDENSGIPWEAIQLGKDFSKHVLITGYSCSALSISLIQSNSPKICYIYPLCNLGANKSACETVNTIQTIINGDFGRRYCHNVLVIESEREMEKII